MGFESDRIDPIRELKKDVYSIHSSGFESDLLNLVLKKRSLDPLVDLKTKTPGNIYSAFDQTKIYPELNPAKLNKY